MAKQTVFWAVLLLAGLNSAVVVKIYFKTAGNVTLELGPPFAERITNILWKHRGNLLAEWVDGKVDLTYYGLFDGRTTLDTTTGRLEIKDMHEADAGLYTVEINSKVQSQSFDAEAIKEVPRPDIFARPLTCSSAADSCTLVCGGDTAGAGPVTYSWKEGDGAWNVSGKDLNIIKSEKAHVETFSCRIQNPVSEKESEAIPNPLRKTDQSESSGVARIVGGIGGVAGLITLVVLVWKREPIVKFLREHLGGGSAEAPAVNGNRLSPGETGNPPAEEHPLKTADTDAKAREEA